jgi:hypothetical protein
MSGEMDDRTPVTDLAELDALDSDEMVEGFMDGFRGEPEPGNNRSKAYWHGWRNGCADRTGETDRAQRVLAHRVSSSSCLCRS